MTQFNLLVSTITDGIRNCQRNGFLEDIALATAAEGLSLVARNTGAVTIRIEPSLGSP